MYSQFHVVFTAVCAGLLLNVAPAHAEDPPQRVGRISFLEGTVSFHAEGEDDWSYAALNYPVVAGNSFWTEPDGRSEVQIGSVDIRMDHGTEMQIVQLDETATRLEVPQGIVNIQFSTPPLTGTVEVMTPAGPIALTHPGTYHIDSGQPTAQGPSGQVQVTALEGQLDINGPRSLLQVMTGETAVLTGNPPSFTLVEGNPTEFDNWALVRERRQETHTAVQYVSPHVTGYEDLDSYGQWAGDPNYGTVWYPNVTVADWAPYRYGQWAYVQPWGWTWVDSAPWGFAPFHYGRWANINHRWGWVPGERVERPTYAPALVAFVGGTGWNVAISSRQTPAVGWVPLAPREVFHPYYPASAGYTQRLNSHSLSARDMHNMEVRNNHAQDISHFANQQGATVVSQNAFERGENVHKNFVPVPANQLAQAPLAPRLDHLARPGRNEDRRGAPPQPQVEPAHAPVIPQPVAPATQQVHAPEVPNMVPNHAHMIEQHVQSPQPVQAPIPPQAPRVVRMMPSHEQAPATVAPQPPQHDASPLIAYDRQHGQQQEHANNPAHAPGPQFHRAPTEERQQEIAKFNAMHAQQGQPVTPAAIPHPQQPAPITPTPQGWQRGGEHHEHQQQQVHEMPHPAQPQSAPQAPQQPPHPVQAQPQPAPQGQPQQQGHGHHDDGH